MITNHYILLTFSWKVAGDFSLFLLEIGLGWFKPIARVIMEQPTKFNEPSRFNVLTHNNVNHYSPHECGSYYVTNNVFFYSDNFDILEIIV